MFNMPGLWPRWECPEMSLDRWPGTRLWVQSQILEAEELLHVSRAFPMQCLSPPCLACPSKQSRQWHFSNQLELLRLQRCFQSVHGFGSLHLQSWHENDDEHGEHHDDDDEDDDDADDVDICWYWWWLWWRLFCRFLFEPHSDVQDLDLDWCLKSCSQYVFAGLCSVWNVYLCWL